MKRVERDEVREERIIMEIIVDAYGPEEQSLGWYYHLEEQLRFPFQARCVRERRFSPLHLDEEVRVEEMGPEDDCGHEMYVMVRWCGRERGTPLS